MRTLVQKLEEVVKTAKPLSHIANKSNKKPHLSEILQSESSSLNDEIVKEGNISKLFQEKAHFYRIDEMVKMKTQDHRYDIKESEESLGFFNKKRKSFRLEDGNNTDQEEIKKTLRNKVIQEQDSLCETDRFKDAIKNTKSNYKISSKKRTDKKKSVKRKLFDRSKLKGSEVNKSRLLGFEKKKPSRDSYTKKKKLKSREKYKRNVSGSKSRIRQSGRSKDSSLIRNKTSKNLYSENPLNDLINRMSKSRKRNKSCGRGFGGGNLRKSRIGMNTKIIGQQKFSIISNKKYS